MKKIFLCLLCVIFAFYCISCSHNNQGENNKEPEIVYYEVTFDSDGGTYVTPQSVVEGGKISIPADPTKKPTQTMEYEFVGWFYGDMEWDFYNNTVSSKINLKAEWNVKQYSQDFPI